MPTLGDWPARLSDSPHLRRWGTLLFLVLAGWLDYVTGPEVASAPFYVVILLVLAFYEPWWICLPFAVLASLIYLGVDLVTSPARLTLIYPYWGAFARLLSFVLISTTTSQLVVERRELLRSENALRENGLQLAERNRRLEETAQEVERLQRDLVAKERQAAVAEALSRATYEMERPLVSVAVYVEEMLRLISRAPAGEEATATLAEILPLVEKVEERTRDLEGVLNSVCDLRWRRESAA